MKAFEVKGKLKVSKKSWQPFAIEVASPNEKAAIEKTMALMGSRHKVKRKFIRIDGVKSLKAEDVTDHAVRHLLGVKQ